jgi:hypothetical protein
MNKHILIYILFPICCGVLIGCGNSVVIITPDYNKFDIPTNNLKRDNVRIDSVIDKRNSPPNQIGIASVGMFNKDVPYILSVSASKFVETALDKLIVKETSEKTKTPITVFIDSFEVGEETTIFSGEVGYFNCNLRFAYPITKDSMVQTSSITKKSTSSLLDVTNSLEDLVYQGIIECAKDFVERKLDKEPNLYIEINDSILNPETIETQIYGVKPDSAKEVLVSSQESYKIVEKYIPPPDNPAIIFESGLGIGLPYGALGFRGSAGNSFIMGEFGIGDYPFSPKTCFSFGGSVHFLDRYNWVRPKVTCIYTSHAATLTYELTDEYKKVVEEISESFNGLAIYGGADIRFARDGNWFLDLNAGWRFPFVGNSGVDKRDNEILNDLRSRGYAMEKESKAWRNFTISLGLNYVIGRSLMIAIER